MVSFPKCHLPDVQFGMVFVDLVTIVIANMNYWKCDGINICDQASKNQPSGAHKIWLIF